MHGLKTNPEIHMPGDIGIFHDGVGFVAGEIIERTYDRLCIAWGDCNRWVDCDDAYGGSRSASLPSMGALIGKRFETFAELLAAIRPHVKPGVSVAELAVQA